MQRLLRQLGPWLNHHRRLLAPLPLLQHGPGNLPRAYLRTKCPLLSAAGPSPPTPPTPPTPPGEPAKQPLMVRIRDEIRHYLQGGKLLAFEARLSARYIAKLVRGHTLTRRELRQLRRTAADMFRLVPFLVLVAIPFAELALPFLLRFFPNMLPSTFQKQFEQEEKRKKLVKMRMELARFLQDTVNDMSAAASAAAPVEDSSGNGSKSLGPASVTAGTGTGSNSAKEFVDFFHKLRSTGTVASTSDVLAIARKFEDELTLERLSRPQLVGMCKYMGIRAFGTDPFLRYQIRTRMRKLAEDDQMIYFEGVDSLSVLELQKACSERGLRATDISPARLRLDLQQWLDLHLVHKIPASLLILSRAFVLSDAEQQQSTGGSSGSSTASGLASALTTVKGQTAASKTDVGELDSASRDPLAANALRATLESLPQALIKEAGLRLTEQPSFEKRLEVIKEEEEEIKAECAAEEEAEEAAVAAAAAENASPVLATEMQVRELGSAIKVLASTSAVEEEREELASLHQAQAQAHAQSLAVSCPKQAQEPVLAAQAQVDKILRRVTAELDEYERDVGSRLNLIKADARGTVAQEDVERALALIRRRGGEKRGVRLDSDAEAQRLVALLDTDNDGRIAVDELLAYAKRLEEQEGHGVVVGEDGSSTRGGQPPPSSSQQQQK